MKKKEKNNNIFIFFIKMLFSFMLVFFVWNFFISILPVAVTYSKYSYLFIVEAFFSLTVLIVMLRSNNSYVFTTKKEKLKKSLELGLPILIFSSLIFISNISTLEDFNLYNTIGVLLYCIAIGIAEEFLCRGWLQNEFIERYSKTKTQVIVSILLSSLIFGFMHITNVFSGQTLFETLLQIAQATASGMFLGSVYFRSKNIWAVVFLHAFYDFSIMIEEANIIKSCTTLYNDDSSMIISIVSSIIIMLFWILGTCINLRKSKLEPLVTFKEVTIEERKKDKITKGILITLMIIVFVSLLSLPAGGERVCYEYKEKEITNREKHYSNYEEFNINYNNPLSEHIELNIKTNDDNKLVITNEIIHEDITLDYESISKYLVIENSSSYSILIYNEDLSDLKVYYCRIFKNDLINNSNYLTKIKESFIAFDVPEIKELGYVTLEDSTYKYPMIETSYDGYFIVDEFDNLYLVNEAY